MTQFPSEPDGESPSQPIDDGHQPDVIPPQLDGALRSAGLDLNDPKVSRAVEITMMVASGPLPLPPPDILQAYEDRFPGIVDRFIRWTEEQRKHRFQLEIARAKRDDNRLDRAQIIAAVVAICGLFASAIVGILGNPVVASILAIVSIGGPTAAVWLARGRSSDEDKGQPNE
jgi:uncharacterized membrane protein